RAPGVEMLEVQQRLAEFATKPVDQPRPLGAGTEPIIDQLDSDGGGLGCAELCQFRCPCVHEVLARVLERIPGTTEATFPDVAHQLRLNTLNREQLLESLGRHDGAELPEVHAPLAASASRAIWPSLPLIGQTSEVEALALT